MAGSVGEWERYGRWNDAIAQVVYPVSEDGRPVYLDLEGDVLTRIRELAEPEAPEATDALVAAVKGTLVFAGASSVLRGHLVRVDRWSAGPMIDAPPTLGLL